MSNITNLMNSREEQLMKWKREKEKALKTAPQGSLRICRNGERVQYYWRTDPKDFNGNYIRNEDQEFVRKLAQKDYDQKVLKAVEAELKAIQKYRASDYGKSVEQIYGSLNPARKKLVSPIELPEEECVKQWENVKYLSKGFGEGIPELYTAKGERVRSKSEVMIADLLNKEGIPYRYEYPLSLRGVGTVYPDFTVLNVRLRKEMLWEHMGMMGDSEYAENAVRKIEAYAQNGIFQGENLILTYETKKNPLNQKTIMLMIERYLL